MSQICQILQKMHPTVRRETISTRLNEKQRLALEAYMVSQKKAQQKASGEAAKTPALCDTTPANVMHRSVQKKIGGIFKSACAGTVYGYYAKAGFHNLTIVTRTQRNPSDAAKDHNILSQMFEQVKGNSQEKDFPATVETAVKTVLEKAGVSEHEFLRHCTVTFAAHQWVGRQLFVHCDQLQSALKVWKLLHDAAGAGLFAPGQQCTTNIAQKAEERWQQMRDAFAALQTTYGKLHQSQLGNLLGELEARRRHTLNKITARWMRQRERAQRKAKAKTASERDLQAALFRRFEHLCCKFERAVEKEERFMRKEKAKRCWDGKESLTDFERRVRRRP